MQSFLILAKEKSKASEYISDFLKEREVNPIDINLQAFEKAMGIEDVRNIQKSILLKPFKGKTKAVIIEAYENITPEAQNALLKILEEPPANTIIIISVSKKELMLPTILSRCKIIALKEKEQSMTNEGIAKLNGILNTIFDGNIGDKLKIAQDVAKNKDEAIIWLEKMIIFVREKLIKNHTESKYLIFLKSLQKTYMAIKSTNVSKRAALENLFLSI